MHRVWAVFVENEWNEWHLDSLFKHQKDADKFVRDWYEKTNVYRDAKVEVWEVN